jgi:uncharacterized protein (TIGR03435 family)
MNEIMLPFKEVRMSRFACTALLAPALASVGVFAQTPTTPAQFDVVSIKRNTSVASSAGLQTLPDGTFIATNQSIDSFILAASPVPTREVVGVPDWARTERYDVTAKPPDGSTREGRAEMMRNLFAERMKLVAHIEERERTTFALVLDRADGRLGPELKPSSLDCTARSLAGASRPAPPALADMRNRCGMAMGPGTIVSGGITMDQLAASFTGLAGGLVNNRTGLQGPYAVSLRFSPRRGAQAPAEPAPIDEFPEFLTALQEQLGLKLQPEKTMVPVLVVDHVERPTEN